MINVAFAFDQRVIDGAAALIASIAFACNRKNVVLHGLYSEHEVDAAKRIHSFCRSLGLRMHADPICDELIQELPGRPTLPRAAFRRLFHPAILSQRCERYLHADTDVIVVNDPTSLLASSDLRFTLGAIRDVGVPNLQSGLSYLPIGSELDPSAPYINSGVMTIDIGRWQERHYTERIIEFSIKHSSQLRLGDQDAINYVLRGDIEELDSRWNVQVGPLDYQRRLEGRPRPFRAALAQRANDAGILHFAGGGKPWAKKWYVLHRGLYYDLLAKSGWKTRLQANAERFSNKLSGGATGLMNYLPQRSS